jgi:hypothetical protein
MMPPSVVERFWSKVVKSDGCWEWTACTNTGYGIFALRRNGKRQILAHRFSYELANGPISDGLYICHRCDNPLCIRPDHLFAGTQADNMRDQSEKRMHYNQRKSHCMHGHALEGDNLIQRKNGSRHCRTCNRKAWREYGERKRAAKRAEAAA